LAGEVSTEAQDGARSGNLVTDCLLSKGFFKEYFTLSGIDSGRFDLHEWSPKYYFNGGQPVASKITSSFSSRRIFYRQGIWRQWISWKIRRWIFWPRVYLSLF